MSNIKHLPEFNTTDFKGETISTESLKGSPTVIFFYPKNFTKGCTAEACSFRDSFEDFKQVGAQVIGVSQDSAASHEKFSEKYHLQYQLISDRGKELQKLFGVKSDMFGLIPGRETFVFNSQGELIHHFKSQVKVEKHVAEAIEAIKQSEEVEG